MRLHRTVLTRHYLVTATGARQGDQPRHTRQLADHTMAEGITQLPTVAATPAKQMHTTKTGTTGTGNRPTVTVLTNNDEFWLGGYATRHEIPRLCTRNPIGRRWRDDQCSPRTSAECAARAIGNSSRSQPPSSLRISEWTDASGAAPGAYFVLGKGGGPRRLRNQCFLTEGCA
jgi:hypothetical protein